MAVTASVALLPGAAVAGAAPGWPSPFDPHPTPRAVQAPAHPPTWSDEFGGTELDSSRWSHRATGARHHGSLVPDAVSVGDGVLTIKTYTRAGKHYSGMIGTYTHGEVGFEQTYGYFEARVKFDSAPGQWSAFWLQSQTIGDPLGDPATAGVEMDVAEHRATCPKGNDPPSGACIAPEDASHRIQQALIWDGYTAGTSKAAVKFGDPLPGLGNGSWHTWAVRWSPTGVTFYYDDSETWSQSGPISRRSQYMILSSEVWETFAGYIPADGYGSRDATTTQMQVDYVRVWALAPVNTTAPLASGSPAVGQALACSTGSWGSEASPTFGYAWLSDGAPIAGAAAAGYTVTAADRGHALACRVTATTAAGATSAVSNALAIPAPPAPIARPAPAAALLPPPPAPPPAPLPPPPPALPVDRTAPAAVLSGATTQKLGATVAVTLACPDEACAAVSAATVRVPRLGRAKARTYRAAARTTRLTRGARATVRLALSKPARRAIARALRGRKRIVVTLTVRVSDAANNRRQLTRRVTLRR